jgi:hypothetical protein
VAEFGGESKEKNEEIKPFNKLINEEYKKPILITDELINFLNHKPKLFDTVLHDKQVYDIFKCYYDDEGEHDLK